ncbi:glycoside hydrolase family 65 protein [Streptomyces griseofuscus]|uniref:Glycosyl transferase n=1 Tax=Streptomyces griseofuscus TaxID=146922 RepID=A0A7H1PSC8_9ACTN|nr:MULTISPECIES: glycosyl hydrolase family 65 protein [Streptomyces]MBJ7005345.1 glycoside hydrolase family 65 protein [Streptomyces sp. CRPSP2-6A1]MYQ94247.1 family 65 glycosyl hydrolase [Streptomyces sp. SID4946]QNT90958.1 glycosyl transferase [Streptomyces griseofuscus]SCF87625.1 alpha,alpha-trehalose phosphorylase [Streptomyces sp. DconLS]
MITQGSYAVEPWTVRETTLDLDVLAQSESVFALSNGHVGWRGNLDEGEPHGLPGSYLNGVHEVHPLPYAEAGYGYPESGQTVINVTNGKVLRLLVDDEPFDLRYGRLTAHERVLDLRRGVLERTCEWTSPAGSTVRVRSTRLVSLTQRAVAAVAYEVEAVDARSRVVIQSELVANESLPGSDGDPRAAMALQSPLEQEDHLATGNRLRLVHRTRRSGLRVAVAADHVVSGPERTTTRSESGTDLARLTVTSVLEPGQSLRVEKLVAHGWSATRSLPAMADQVDAALAAAAHDGWPGLLADQRACLDDFWARADVEVSGDEEIQQAVRFALFHVLQAGARAERRAIPAKGLTGSGYDGHAFWDTEMFVLPVLTHTAPAAVAQALRWRYSTLDEARERAAQLGLAGAAFPWRTIAGPEGSAYWPAGTAAFHVNAGIADAVVRYVEATDDTAFEREAGVELLVETARLWRSLGHHDAHGVFHLDGVTGPDEYSAVADDNAYTNLMARQNLLAAADVVERHPREAARLGVDEEESAAWRDAAGAMHVPYNAELGVHEQHSGFTRYQRWDFDGTRSDQYPLLLHFPYFDLYRKQVVKQADLVLALYTCDGWFAERYDEEQIARNFAYYEPLTVRDSSLSACCQAVVAARTGHLDLAYDYTAEAALMDLHDLEHNTRDGLHIASLAGTWMALVAGFGGMRRDGERLRFAPRLPERLSRLAFHVQFRGRRLRVEIDADKTTYELLDGPPLDLRHHGDAVTVTMSEPAVRPVPPGPRRALPQQPRHRVPNQAS